jgi:hypothetical protein
MLRPADDVQRWEQLRGVIRSSKGGWLMGKGVTNHGYSQLGDLVPNASYFQVLILNIVGWLPELRLAQWAEAVFICCSWPDPRIWCNQIAALGGAARVSAVSAVCAGSMSGDSANHGPGSVAATGRFLIKALEAVRSGQSVEEFVESQAIVKGRLLAPGFVRPLAHGDDRVTVLLQLAEELGYECGPYQELVFSMHDYLQERCGESLNMGGFCIAFMLDQGFPLVQTERIITLVFSGGLHACYAEYRDLPPDSYLPLRCDDIDYVGVPERPVPTD